MSKLEGERFLAQAQGRTCVSYETQADGLLVTRTRWQGLRQVGKRISRGAFALLATLAPMFFAACTRSNSGEGTRTGGVYCDPAEGKDSPPKRSPKHAEASPQVPTSPAIVTWPPPDSASAG